MNYFLVEWKTYDPYYGCSWESNYCVIKLKEAFVDDISIINKENCLAYIPIYISSKKMINYNAVKSLKYILHLIKNESEGKCNAIDNNFSVYSIEETANVVPIEKISRFIEPYRLLGLDLIIKCVKCGEEINLLIEYTNIIKFDNVQTNEVVSTCDGIICSNCLNLNN